MPDSIGLGTQDILDVCQSVEMACAELYHYFAELFKEDRETFRLWLKTALEEENHSRQYALIAKLRSKNVIESIQLELLDAEIALLYVRSLIDRVKQHPPGQLEALRIAIDLEQKLDGFLVEKVVLFSDPSHERSFKAIDNSDSRHVEALQEAYQRKLAQLR